MFNSFAAFSCEDEEKPGMEALRSTPSNSFSDAPKNFLMSVLEIISLLSPNKTASQTMFDFLFSTDLFNSEMTSYHSKNFDKHSNSVIQGEKTS